MRLDRDIFFKKLFLSLGTNPNEPNPYTAFRLSRIVSNTHNDFKYSTIAFLQTVHSEIGSPSSVWVSRGSMKS